MMRKEEKKAVIHGIIIFGPPVNAKRLTEASGDMIYRLTYAGSPERS